MSDADPATPPDLAPDDGGADPVDEDGFDRLVEHLRVARGFDFGGYKRSSLARRVRRRMQTVGVDAFDAYVDYLEVHPDEFPQLFNTILINVTSFFRDEAAWTALRGHIERRVAEKPADAPIRVWSAGCASGEEAYTLAMILAEILGMDAFVRRVKIYATDVDEEALAQARTASYGTKQVEGVPAELLERYFTRAGAFHVFHRDLRRQVIFGRHDLVQDAPISRVDVLTCRNTLMYFNAETQTRILGRLHFALAPEGILFLGKAEMLLTHAALFAPLDMKLRIFARANRRLRERAVVAGATPTFSESDMAAARSSSRLARAGFDALPVASVVLDVGGRIALVNQRAAILFGLGGGDLGRPFHEIELSYRPADLRSLLDLARTERRSVRIEGVERVTTTSEKTFLDIEVTPLLDGTAVVGTELCFVDNTRSHRLQAELRTATMELEASHEEIQSTVEELETTNEELQSTNEELETMNEELQSTNEELQTMNEELRQRSDELNQANAFLGTILASLRCGVAVLDQDLHVHAWNDLMADLWGLRGDEVRGKHFFSLDIGLPIDQLRQPVRGCLAPDGEGDGASGVETTLEATNRRGRRIQVRVTARPLRSDSIKGVLVIVEEP